MSRLMPSWQLRIACAASFDEDLEIHVDSSLEVSCNGLVTVMPRVQARGD
jgi:hypothetical protein